MNNAPQILNILEKTHQPTMLELLGSQGYTPFQLLIATLLSARSKDSFVIPLVKRLFKKHPNPEDLVDLPDETLEQELYGVGFFRVKTKNVKKLCKILIEQYDGQIPQSLEELTSLPGVGRKTANCILNYVFHQPAIAVDIHVHRIANRLGWIKTKTPEESEFALLKVIPKEDWIRINRLLVGHGQTICAPRNPKCSQCPVKKLCPSSSV
jgi:endonuclease III